jgi:L-threonylcarbamoyladenylate synthase
MSAKKADKIAKIDATYPDSQLIAQAAGLIAKGKVVVCPTDTGYAFSANALDVRAIARVFALKSRDFNNPIHVAVASMDEAEKYAEVDKRARYLAARFLPGALTLVLKRKAAIPPLLVGGRDTIGIRIPDNRIILEMAAMAGLPLTTTSANISGQPATYAVEEITAQLGEAVKDVALFLDQGPLAARVVSTVVDLTIEPPQLIRAGKVSWLDIHGMLSTFTG